HPAPATISTLSLHDALPISLPNFQNLRQGRQERCHNIRVEMMATLFTEESQSILNRPCRLVRSCARQGVEHIRNGYDSSFDRDRSEEHTSELQSRDISYAVF